MAMTFSKHFELNTVAEWTDFYVRYREFRDILENLNAKVEKKTSEKDPKDDKKVGSDQSFLKSSSNGNASNTKPSTPNEVLRDNADLSDLSAAKAAPLTISSSGFDTTQFLDNLSKELLRVSSFKLEQEKKLAKLQDKETEKAKKSKGFSSVGKSLGKLLQLYDGWNKLKSFSVVNRQAFEDIALRLETYLQQTSPAATGSYGESSSSKASAFIAQLTQSPIADVKLAESHQARLERKGLLGKGVISSGVRRPTTLEVDIVKSSMEYEKWLEKVLPCELVRDDVKFKYRQMATNEFMFMRATFYRWVQLWPVILPGLSAAPHVLAVGDLHVDNFGTWRDAEGRWAWGINDFDEAFPMAYTIDLVRLGVSAILAATERGTKTPVDELLRQLLQGYRDCLEKGGEPIILAEAQPRLLSMAISSRKDSVKYWRKIQANCNSAMNAPNEIKTSLTALLPEGSTPFMVAHRQGGLGSLGRPRYVILAKWRGGIIGRETKPAVPSACYFAASHNGPYESRQGDIINLAVRTPDPFFSISNTGWLIRRLTSEAGKIGMEKLLPEEEQELYYWMGWEVANVHQGSSHATENVKEDLASRPTNWLYNAAQQMRNALNLDFLAWKKYYGAVVPRSSL